MVRRRWAVGLSAAFVVAALVGSGAEAQSAPVADAPEAATAASEPRLVDARGNRSISGSIQGIDGRRVNAQISLVLRTANDQPVRMNGQVHDNRGEYAMTLSMNPGLPVDGDPLAGTDQWSIGNLPANAASFTLEVYPRSPGHSPDFSHYGGAVRRTVRLPANTSLQNLNVVFPIRCAEGGTTGTIRIRRYVDGQPRGGMSRFLATGADYPASAYAGFQYQHVIPAGATEWEHDALAPNHRYGVEMYVGRTRFGFFEVPVRECRRTDIVAWSGRRPPLSVLPPRFSRLPARSTGPGFPVPGDFDGDGDDDLFFYAGANSQMSTSTGTGNGFTTAAMPAGGTHRVASGDFNADGIDDLFFFGWGANPDRIWQFTGPGNYSVLATTANVGSNQSYPLVGDFDANGFDDILFVNPVGGSTMRRYRQGGQTDTGLALPRGFTVRAGDFTGERRADLVMYRRNRNNGDVQAWLTNPGGTTFRTTSYQVQPAAFQPVVADYSGDFKDDIVWYQPGAAIDVFWKGFSPTAPYFARETANLGMTGNWVPVAGDFNGDGTADIFFYGPGNAGDQVWRSNQTAWLAQKVAVIP